MRTAAIAPLAEMQSLLRGVSRSFYLSIRLLPAPLRRPVAVAYLLARAADTIADTPGQPADERLARLQALSAAIETGAERPAGWGAGRSSIRWDSAGAPGQPRGDAAANPAEERLMLLLPDCLRWLDTLEAADRHDVRTVLRHITHGQSLDLQRFGDGASIQALPDAAELDRYTYLVAGCVGEFWTDLCARHVPDFAVLSAARMRDLGRDYGMGLQLVNILRDCGEDLAQGRCYLPADELAAEGLSPGQVQPDPRQLAPVWGRWHALALDRMDAGERYAQAVNSPRIRAAGVLPALLGARTLALLQEAGPLALVRRVKVPRREVRRILARLALTLARRQPLAAQYRRLREQPASGWDNPAR